MLLLYCLQEKWYPEWHKECMDTALAVQKRSIMQWYTYKIEEKERPKESEEVQKLRTLFFEKESAEK